MNGPNFQPGAPIMPQKHETAPKWSEEELRMAKDFQIFVAESAGIEGENYRDKRNRVVQDFARLYYDKYSVLGGGPFHVYTDLPQGMRSAASHLANEARARRSESFLLSRVAQAKEEWWHAYLEGSPEDRIAMGDPDIDPDELARLGQDDQPAFKKNVEK